MAHASKEIIDQILVAFGQGTGAVRVARDAAAALRDRYEPYVDDRILRDWDEVAVQVLERFRTMGRFAALRAAEGASTVITRPMVTEAIERVEKVSMTVLCPPAFLPQESTESVEMETLDVAVR